MLKILANAAIFQVGWFVSVLYGDVAAGLVFVTAVAVYAAFYLQSQSDILLICSVILLGYLGDTLLGSLGILIYPSGRVFPPFWMVTLWLLFAMTLPWSLRWIAGHRYWFILFSAIGGPLSYVVGVNLTAVQFGSGVVYAVALVSMLWLAHGLLINILFIRWQGTRNSL